MPVALVIRVPPRCADTMLYRFPGLIGLSCRCQLQCSRSLPRAGVAKSVKGSSSLFTYWLSNMTRVITGGIGEYIKSSRKVPLSIMYITYAICRYCVMGATPPSITKPAYSLHPIDPSLIHLSRNHHSLRELLSPASPAPDGCKGPSVPCGCV